MGKMVNMYYLKAVQLSELIIAFFENQFKYKNNAILGDLVIDRQDFIDGLASDINDVFNEIWVNKDDTLNIYFQLTEKKREGGYLDEDIVYYNVIKNFFSKSGINIKQFKFPNLTIVFNAERVQDYVSISTYYEKEEIEEIFVVDNHLYSKNVEKSKGKSLIVKKDDNCKVLQEMKGKPKELLQQYIDNVNKYKISRR